MTWRFYQLSKQECYESLAYSETQLADILGILNYLFADCQTKLLNHCQSCKSLSILKCQFSEIAIRSLL